MLVEIFPTDHPEFNNHRVFKFSDPEAGILVGFFCIHSLVRTPIVARFNTAPERLGVRYGAKGGTRIYPYPNENEALTDGLRLSRGMSYKAMLAGLEIGGGKAVIVGNPKTVKTERFLRGYGKFISELNDRILIPNYGGIFMTGEDSGVTSKDVDVMAFETPYVFGTTKGAGDPFPITSYGIRCGIEACLQFVFKYPTINGRRFLVQGVGNVGSHLANDLHRRGGSLIVSDIDKEKVIPFLNRPSILATSPEDNFLHEVDVLVPCARGAILNEETIPKLRCKIVAGAANNQLAHPESRNALLLHERKILYAPDFVINAGGLIHVYHECLPEGYDKNRVKKHAEKIKDTLRDIFKASGYTNTPTHDIAVRVAKDRLATKERTL